MDDILITLLGVGGAVVVIYMLTRARASTDDAPSSADPKAELYRIAELFLPQYENSAHPRDLLDNPVFQEGVALLRTEDFSTDQLLGYFAGHNQPIVCMALAALRERPDSAVPQRLIAGMNNISAWAGFHVFRVLQEYPDEPLLGPLLAELESHWYEHPFRPVLVDFVTGRLAIEPDPRFGEKLADLDEESSPELRKLLGEFDHPGCAALLREMDHWKKGRIDLEFLRSVGRLWSAEHTAIPLVETPQLTRHVAEVEAELGKSPPRSVLLVGPAGVGKTTILRALARRLLAQDWVVFEAGSVELLAGQIYHGSLEERMQTLVRNLTCGARVLWVVPDLHELAWAGRHQYSSSSVLDFCIPYLEKGTLVLIGEVQPTALERLVQSKPQLRTACAQIDVGPLAKEPTLELARQWSALHASSGTVVTEDVAHEALELAQQYLPDKAAPGNLLQLLETTRTWKKRASTEPTGIERADLLVNLSRLTGLPLAMLDEREGLDLDELRAFFDRRVLGQPEAVNCLVDRVALIKAGLNDPSRPLGVFLFCGPTGTGKTEIAKTLAEYLFGSADRMIRLDMSEFQTAESLGSILGEADERAQGSALVHRIRKQPFSVLLLDEFEKAHPNIWDLFLQVFDDGRLTDRRGNLADFRHAIIIITSNLGSDALHRASIGFGEAADRTWNEEVHKTLEREFRPEFLNRIDRIVVFRTLDRPTMRKVLEKELASVLSRRGMRHRQWAVEWDEAAIEFLLNAGFSPQLGARPLRRAIEHHLLAPLATAIVTRNAPAGDQFLFVGTDGKALDVSFVDPDAPEPAAETAPRHELCVESIALDGTGSEAELAYLESLHEDVRQAASTAEWHEQRGAAMAAMSAPSFWQSNDRFAQLGRVEYMDRVDRGLESAGSLLRRLRGKRSGTRERYPQQLVRRVAQQLYLLRAAVGALEEGTPRDAFLRVDISGDPNAPSAQFAERIAGMYRRWAAMRRMHWLALEEPGANTRHPHRQTYAITGYASYDLLRPDSGLHVLEVDEGTKSMQRHRVRVRVAPQPFAPTDGKQEALEAADRAFSETPEDRSLIVRRYREQPSPLVRDGVRNWRTGRLDRVLAGDFDLIG